MTYILARKIKSKWYGLAGWTPKEKGSCLAIAEDVFQANGFQWNHWENTVRCYWGSIENQKNYAGRLPDFREVH